MCLELYRKELSEMVVYYFTYVVVKGVNTDVDVVY